MTAHTHSALALALLAALASALLAACNQKELCWDHAAHTPYRTVDIRADYEQVWEYTYDGPDWAASWASLATTIAYDDLRPARPDGLRILVYPAGGTGYAIYNLEPEGGTLSFTEGSHSMLFYNNGTQYIVFDQLNSYASARATTRSRSRATYLGSPYSDEQVESTVNSPDMLYGHYIDEFAPPAALEVQHLDVTLRPLVFTYLVRYRFASGGANVALARGALAGMAKDVFLNSGRTSAEPATILFDCEQLTPGYAEAQVLSFGVPDFPNDHYARSLRSYGLNLEVKLRDGTTADYNFDVTDQVAAQPRGGVIDVGDIVIPDTGSGSGSLFTVDVVDWGEAQDIILPI